MMEYTGEKFLKKDALPLFWCSGCGNGILLGAIFRAMEQQNLTRENTVVVTGIGCWGKADDYFTTNSFHGTHGRAIAVATGIKLANPDLNVITLVGDGDGITIGGNHLIHAARRNIDITVIMSNNFNYGMTGGQYSGTTPFDKITSTSRYGHIEEQFDVSQMVKTAGAAYVARETVGSPDKLQLYISDALKRKNGFRFIEALNVCPTHFGKNNKKGSPAEMIEGLKKNSLNIKAAKKMEKEKIEGKFITGVLVDNEVDGYIKRYTDVQHKAKNIT